MSSVVNWLLGLVAGFGEWACGVVEGAWEAVPVPTDSLSYFVQRCDRYVPMGDIITMLSILTAILGVVLVYKAVMFVLELVPGT